MHESCVMRACVYACFQAHMYTCILYYVGDGVGMYSVVEPYHLTRTHQSVSVDTNIFHHVNRNDFVTYNACSGQLLCPCLLYSDAESDAFMHLRMHEYALVC